MIIYVGLISKYARPDVRTCHGSMARMEDITQKPMVAITDSFICEYKVPCSWDVRAT